MEQFLAIFPNRIERTYEEGQIILRQGEKRGQLYILGSGSVEVIKNGVQLCTVSDAGAIFGELSVLLNNYHNATVRARENCKFYIVDKAAEFLNQNPAAALHIAQLLARRLALLDSYFTELKKEFQDLSQQGVGHLPKSVGSPETEIFNDFWDKAEKGKERRWHMFPDDPR